MLGREMDPGVGSKTAPETPAISGTWRLEGEGVSVSFPREQAQFKAPQKERQEGVGVLCPASDLKPEDQLGGDGEL